MIRSNRLCQHAVLCLIPILVSAQPYDNLYVATSRVWASSSLANALSMNDSRTIVLDTNITTHSNEGSQFHPSVIGDGRHANALLSYIFANDISFILERRCNISDIQSVC